MQHTTRKYLTRLMILTGLLLPLYATADKGLATFTVSTGEVKRERLFDGVVEAIQQTTVSAQTQGRIIEINFDIDDYVEKDAILIKISDHEQSARATQASANISEVRAQLRLVETNFRRLETLLAKKTISQSEYDDAQTALQRARASLQTAEAARDEALKQVEYTVVRAPYSGIVTARLVELGESVTPGMPLMSGFSLDYLRVRTEVPNRFAQHIEADKGVDVILDTDPTTRIHSADITVFPFANPRSNSVTVRVELPSNIEGLYPGMLTKIAFQTLQAERILIPQSAVFFRSELTGVYIINGETIRLRRVSIGQTYTRDNGELMVEVLAGLKTGETVAQNPVDAVRQLKAQANSSQPKH